MKTIFITGAAMGIGRAAADYFYQQGWSLGLSDLNLDALEAFQKDKDPKRVSIYALDVTNASCTRKTIDKFCLAHDGQLDVLLNNAGVLKVGNFEDLSIEEHQLTTSVNIDGVIHCMHAAFTYLKRTPNAKVINLSSASSNYGVPELASYSATKFAVKALTEALEIEWKQHDITVCSVVPSFVKTHMLTSQEVTSKLLARMGSNIAPEDVVRTIAKQAQSPTLHRPVGWSYALLYHLSNILPRAFSELMMKVLSR